MAGLETSVELLPDPKRMIEGLRDTGYEFNTAVADILDNSIAAEATDIDLLVDMDFRGEIRLALADNGYGMDLNGLKNAMRYGAEMRPSPASLGKYGLGLKTASTAFCRKLSVISRSDSAKGVWMATWDLDHVGSTGKWDLLLTDQPEKDALEQLDRIAPGKSGTVVLWQKVDRLMKDYTSPTGKPARKALEQKLDGLRRHLAMVYQRFLDPKDKRARNVAIRVNNRPVSAWDPFVPSLSELVASETDFKVELPSGQEATFSVRAYVLPRREEFPSPEQAKDAEISNDNQGIYIYRENRLIREADWLGIYQKEPHVSLLRVEFSFDHKLDDAFHLDIKKSQIILNDDLWTWLSSQFLPAPRREAEQRYREGQKKKIGNASAGAHDGSNRNIKDHEAAAGGAKVNVVDPNTGECTIENAHGKFRLKLPIGPAMRPGEVYVQPVDGIDNGLLFEPALIEQHRAVRINRLHAYYRKVYVPNFNRAVTMQGMDSLLWALAVAELSAVHENTFDHFKDLRYELSRILGKLVEGMPEPELKDDVA